MSEIEKISKKMSWGTELWDQYENLSAHTNKGVQLLDKFGNFIRDRVQIEAEYAAKLRKLVKSYQPKKIEDEDNELTSSQAFCNMLREIGEIAGHREAFVESLKQQIAQGISELSNKLQQERKACLHDYTTLQQNLNLQMSTLERAKRHYEKAYLESNRAIENYKKADLDLNLSRAEVYRCNSLRHTKMQECDDAKLEYAKQLQKTNTFQEQHFMELLPAVLNRLQFLDQKRSLAIGHFINFAADVEFKLTPLLNNCLKSIKAAVEEIDEEHDSKQIVKRLKTGQMPPTDIAFEDLSKQVEEESVLPLKSAKSANSFIKDIALFKIYKSIKQRRITEACVTLKNLLTASNESTNPSGDLTPNKRKKLHLKIGELHKKIKKETDAYNDLMKLKDAFECNLASGDPERVTEQLRQLAAKIEKFKEDLKKYQSYLEKPHEHPNGSSRSSVNLVTTETEGNSESAGAEIKSFKSSIAESNASKVKKWLENLSEANNESPENSLGTSQTSIFDSGKGSVNEIIIGVTEAETTTETSQTTKIFCALYSIEKTREETLSISESEVV